MRPGRWIAAMLVTAAMLALMTGCWDNREPRRRAYVLGLAIDQDQQDPSRLTVTIQLPVPYTLRGGQAGGGTAPDYTLLQGTGPTVVEAMQDAQDRISRDLFFGQMRVMILSSLLSPAQLRQLTDEIRRNPDVEETVYLLVARGRADALLGQRSPQERLPALYFNTVFEAVRRNTISHPVQVWEFWRANETPGWEPILPVAELVGRDQVRLAGLAVFRAHELRGFLEPEEAQGYLWLTGLTSMRVLSLQTERGLTAVRSLRVSRSVSVRMRGARPEVLVRLRLTGEVALPARHPVDKSQLESLERAAVTQVQRQIAAAVRKVQDDYESDVFGFGKLLYYRHPAYFDRVRWETVFPDIRIEHEVEVRLIRKGTIH